MGETEKPEEPTDPAQAALDAHLEYVLATYPKFKPAEKTARASRFRSALPDRAEPESKG